MKNRLVVASLAVGLVGGGLAGWALGLSGLAGAAGSSPAVSTATDPATTPTSTPGTGSGPFKSNEDATHETGEPAAREAAENSGQGFHGGRGGHSNEDSTHESSESTAREAQENAGTSTPTTTPASPAT